MRCGHVQGKHDWGIIRHPSNGDSPPTAFKCPICLTESERVIQLCMGMESAFHLDSSALDFCFNPCGHVASLATVRYIEKRSYCGAGESPQGQKSKKTFLNLLKNDI